jgi:hypothetical protein
LDHDDKIVVGEQILCDCAQAHDEIIILALNRPWCLLFLESKQHSLSILRAKEQVTMMPQF